jgi:hypothetical protein
MVGNARAVPLECAMSAHANLRWLGIPIELKTHWMWNLAKVGQRV